MAIQGAYTAAQRFRIVTYNLFLRRTSTMAIFLVGCGSAGLAGMNRTVDAIWDSRNAGKHFKDIHKTFPVLVAEDEEDHEEPPLGFCWSCGAHLRPDVGFNNSVNAAATNLAAVRRPCGQANRCTDGGGQDSV
eukprot:CAMPEP_0198735188 /NCGR_PEP_ID=MMETSP1475-20131203/57797_1 /TAXON_ID= ORGANISM="Unidentified sp., Strain CCMP1999" /NCGR_SAMPLE_ID=MMETSP1475 /ASSEMBLY_ACC=CAM_ASM_001111 /LENGTH=132 /DNA_ID=CAMNT_0044498799 /DNA_START=134 /DNA_END=530 /DNA_ORIENTATION=+